MINGIDADASFKLKKMEFIELRTISDSHEDDFSLEEFCLLVLEYTQRRDKPIVTTVIPLFNETFKDNRIFTIGGENIE